MYLYIHFYLYIYKIFESLFETHLSSMMSVGYIDCRRPTAAAGENSNASFSVTPLTVLVISDNKQRHKPPVSLSVYLRHTDRSLSLSVSVSVALFLQSRSACRCQSVSLWLSLLLSFSLPVSVPICPSVGVCLSVSLWVSLAASFLHCAPWMSLSNEEGRLSVVFLVLRLFDDLQLLKQQLKLMKETLTAASQSTASSANPKDWGWFCLGFNSSQRLICHWVN